METIQIMSVSDNNVDCRVFRENNYMIIKGSLKNPSKFTKKLIVAPNPPDYFPLKTLRDRIRGNPSFYALKEQFLPIADAEDKMYHYSAIKQTLNLA